MLPQASRPLVDESCEDRPARNIATGSASKPRARRYRTGTCRTRVLCVACERAEGSGGRVGRAARCRSASSSLSGVKLPTGAGRHAAPHVNSAPQWPQAWASSETGARQFGHTCEVSDAAVCITPIGSVRACVPERRYVTPLAPALRRETSASSTVCGCQLCTENACKWMSRRGCESRRTVKAAWA